MGARYQPVNFANQRVENFRRSQPQLQHTQRYQLGQSTNSRLSLSIRSNTQQALHTRLRRAARSSGAMVVWYCMSVENL